MPINREPIIKLNCQKEQILKIFEDFNVTVPFTEGDDLKINVNNNDGSRTISVYYEDDYYYLLHIDDLTDYVTKIDIFIKLASRDRNV
jgi:hypothetical protein